MNEREDEGEEHAADEPSNAVASVDPRADRSQGLDDTREASVGDAAALDDAAFGDTMEASRDARSSSDPTVDQRPRSADGREKRKPLARGATLGRYVVLELIGEGAMGGVYAAYDPELDRKVALKVLLHAPGARAVRKEGSSRLLREAQAMARLSHPNVIQVFDVGVLHEDVYIAMEHVDGQSLTSWLAAEKRSPDAIRDVFLQAARGLAHAHEAGVVHRDFKPDNCLVGRDARVRVIDFGIARAGEGSPGAATLDEEELQRALEGSPAALLDPVKTRAGMLIGTPAYMSAEQFEGRAVDARSDQFAFCVAAYEALYGRRPYAGESVLELRSEVTCGQLREPPLDAPVPAHVKNALMRGLSRDPAQRFEDMHALVAALGPPSAPRTGRWVAIGAAALALSVLGALVLYRSPTEGLCRGLDAHLAGVWDDAERARVSEAFEATGAEYAGASLERVTERLDARARAWTRMRTDACEATRLRGEQTEPVLELRNACLDRRLRELDATVDVLAGVNRETLDNAAQIVSELSPIDRCADVERLEAESAHRPPPELSEEVDAFEERLARLRALTEAGDYEHAAPLADELLGQARAIGWPPLEAETLFRRARVLLAQGHSDEASDDLFEAVRLADRHHALATEAEAWIDLVFVVGRSLRKGEEGLRWAGFARATLDELGQDSLLWARLRYAEGTIYALLERHEEALTAFADADRFYAEILPPEHWRFAVVEGARASALNRLGRVDEAISGQRRALAIMRAAMGDRHPGLGTMLNNLATALRASGDLEGARRTYEEALALKRATLGDDHPSVAIAYSNLGMLEQRLGHYDRAAELFTRSRELRQRTLGESHPRYALSLAQEAGLALDRGRMEEGVEISRRVLNLRQAHGEPWPVAEARASLAWALLRSGRPDEAEPLARAAVGAAVEQNVSAPLAAYPRTVLGVALVELGRPRDAIGELSLAASARSEGTVDPESLALTRFALGRALFESGEDTARGWALVDAAREGLEAAGPPGEWARAACVAWLAAHPRPPIRSERR
jgi:tetratricopeptide (TPR) repeat protein/tRNA A-37 threonylcarbamoyl transferase component Bud32